MDQTGRDRDADIHARDGVMGTVAAAGLMRVRGSGGTTVRTGAMASRNPAVYQSFSLQIAVGVLDSIVPDSLAATKEQVDRLGGCAELRSLGVPKGDNGNELDQDSTAISAAGSDGQQPGRSIGAAARFAGSGSCGSSCDERAE